MQTHQNPQKMSERSIDAICARNGVKTWVKSPELQLEEAEAKRSSQGAEDIKTEKKKNLLFSETGIDAEHPIQIRSRG